MQITPARLESLHTEFSRKFQEGRGQAKVWSGSIVTEIPSNTKTTIHGFIEAAIKLRKWDGPRVSQNLKAKYHEIPNVSYEGTLELDRDDIEDDNLGLFQSAIVPQFGVAVAKHLDRRLAKLMQDNTELAFDGLPLFDNTHLCGANAYDNLAASPFSADNLDLAYQAMTGYVDEKGDSLEVRPNLLFHAPQLKRKVMQVLSAGTIAQAVTNVAGAENVAAATPENVMQGWMTPVEVPEWGNTPKMWVLADTTKGIAPFVRQMRRAYEFNSLTSPQDPNVFFQKKFYYGTDGREGLGITLPWLIYLGNKST